MYLADLHIHSKFSMATSRDCDAAHLEASAREKGLRLIGTGDFTHPGWREELRRTLVPAEDGLYALKEEYRLPTKTADGGAGPRFVVTGEISSIYKKSGKTRKVHSLILLPSLEAADVIADRLEAIGNIRSDGRPILGLDARDLLEITLDACPEAVYVPAHIWTPHFSLFGAFSDFSSVEECYGDMAGEINALETGLSSDPPMNWMVSALDPYALLSNSDAHSPAKLGREANLLDTELSYPALRNALGGGEGLAGTLEFFPEEGKYHLDGHRKCGCRLEPDETRKAGGLCPVCGKKVTVGVKHRVYELADHPEGFQKPGAKPFESLVPLRELLAAATGSSAAGKQTDALYTAVLRALGPEFHVLREASLGDIETVAGSLAAEAIRRVRNGLVERDAGFDGEYGTIRVFAPGERESLQGQTSMFGFAMPKKKSAQRSQKLAPKEADRVSESPQSPRENEEQRMAIEARERVVAVVAGPGTGKTHTLIERVAYLIEKRGAKPSDILAVTFTNQAANEMRDRLAKRLGDSGAANETTIGTFHSVCLRMLEPKPILGESEAHEILGGLLAAIGSKRPVREVQAAISAVKSGKRFAEAGMEEELFNAYVGRCGTLGVRDLDDVLLDALALPQSGEGNRIHLLVDEFQDINAVQRALTRKWAERCESLFVIGDPDQSIYGFRGASADCFEELRQDFQDMRSIRLETNYRSTPQILKAALNAINRNSGGQRRLLATLPDGEKVRVVRADTPLSEGVWVAKEIAALAGGLSMLDAKNAEPGRSTRSFSDIAVLARTRRQLTRIESCLRHDDIPCVICGRGEELDDEGVKGALAFFQYCLYPRDELALYGCLKPIWGFDARGEAQLSDQENGLPPGFIACRETFLPLVEEERPAKLIALWIERQGDSPALQKLKEVAAFHGTMRSLLSALTLGEEADIRRASGRQYATGAVRLMTLHGAKGLEFPVVFLCGASEKTLPLEREGESIDIEEERRLFFVGITRAKEELIVTGSDPLSPFLSDLPDAQRQSARSYSREKPAEQLRFF